jgi:hypothetical protein
MQPTRACSQPGAAVWLSALSIVRGGCPWWLTLTVRLMKAPVTWACWIGGAALLYVLSSGPAQLLSETPAWKVLFPVYLPLKLAASHSPARRVMYPYWRLFCRPHPSIFEDIEW